ncbi:MAG TPA: hypothetical protein VHL57_07220 [Flavobacteriales bacterium]|jgi:thioredoxin-like negative regulator of GroEL|nr:hypothetical protein [Flavobacteriales bacterium]
MRSLILASLLLVGLASCTPDKRTLCQRFYEPYPDHVSGRASTRGNLMLTEAMTHYNKGEYAEAANGLRAVVDRNESDLTARMYLVSALIGAGEPYKAEMHLDYMENAKDQNFRDQVEWYNALCWLCTDQQAKALQQAQWIAAKPAHAYKDAAQALALTLTDQ